MEQMNQSGLTLLVVTHDPLIGDVPAAGFSSRTATWLPTSACGPPGN